MKVLIISDTHYLRKNELNKFFKQFSNIHDIIHCGDIYLGFQPNDFLDMHICKGNNDFADIPRFSYFTIDNIRFLITHGHINDYAYKPQKMKELLKDYPADIICFGHTHVPYYYKDHEIMMINPGSLSLGRSYPRKNTYAIFDTTSLEVHFYDVKNHQEMIIPQQ